MPFDASMGRALPKPKSRPVETTPESESEHESEYDSDESDVPPWHEELPPPPPRPLDPDLEPICARELFRSTTAKTAEGRGESSASVLEAGLGNREESLQEMAQQSTQIEKSSKGQSRKKKTLLDAVSYRKSNLYDNCRLLGQNGVDLMAMISRKRYNWYVKKGIAEIIDSHSIRILFEPKGPGGAEYGITEKENICVVCGSDSRLFRTYIVPHSYRAQFPPHLCASQSHDVVLQCEKCFPLWAKASGDMRQQLAKEYNAPVNGLIIVDISPDDSADPASTATTQNDASTDDTIPASPVLSSPSTSPTPSAPRGSGGDADSPARSYTGSASILSRTPSQITMTTGSHMSAKSASKALLKGGECIPAERRVVLLERVARFLGREPRAADLEEIVAALPAHAVAARRGDRIKSHEQIVVEQFRGREGELVRMWRQLFLEKCDPKRLPPFWSVDFVKD